MCVCVGQARAVTSHAPQFASYVEQQFQQRQGRGSSGMGRMSNSGGAGGGGIGADSGGGMGSGVGGGGGGGGGKGGKGESLQELGQRGDWERCLEVAQRMGQDGIDHYVTMHTTGMTE